MRRRVGVPLPPFPANEEARDLIVRARAALSDEHVEGALRSLEELHGLLVPLLDRILLGQENAQAEGALSSGAGFLGLWRELLDADVERESIQELILFYAGTLADSDVPDDAPLSAVSSEEQRAAQWAYLSERLRSQPVPQAQFFRRLARSADGGLGDRARVVVRRGDRIVFERTPDEHAEGLAPLYSTDLGEFLSGDQLSLMLSVPLPGRVALLSALENEQDQAEALLEVLWPQHHGEDEPRRALETIEVSGELAAVPAVSEQSLLCIWVPEKLPAAWPFQVVARRRLPPEARLWRYSYRVKAA